MNSPSTLKTQIKKIAARIEGDEDITSDYYALFIEHPELALQLIDIIQDLNEDRVEKKPSFYTACVFILDVCISQLQSLRENDNKQADKLLNQLMSHLSAAINQKSHSLSYWLPVLNTFYEVQIPLPPDLKDAYYDLAHDEGESTYIDENVHLNSIRDLILELSDLSVFEIAENFFAQSYAMPEDFFVDLVWDLYNIDEGQDIALLALLHPTASVRDAVISAFDNIIPTVTLSPISLSRLQQIKHWYPAHLSQQFDRWIRIQRKKGVVFHRESDFLKIIRIKASEIDGSGAQGIFIQLQKKRQHRLCGILFKQKQGIKDTWMTPVVTASEVAHYYGEAFDDTLVLRDVNLDYLTMMTEHFLASTLEQGDMPNLHLLEMQEALGLQFVPKKIDVDELIQQLSVQINPFTTDTLEASLKRSKQWLNKMHFTDAWFIESASVDKLVNQCSSFVDGIKICELDQAIDVIFQENMEPNRDRWLFHFLWTALWLKARHRKNSMLWQDSFIIAYLIHSGAPLDTLPLLREICRQSALNSIETMQERKTYLS